MMQSAKAIALSMFCSLALAGCASTKIAVASRPDLDNPARLVCEASSSRPEIPAEYAIDWSRVVTVEQAKAEHDAYVRSIRTREGIVAGYVVDVEGKLFVCSNNAQWWRDYWKGLEPGN